MPQNDYLVSITLKAVDLASGVFAKVSGEASQTENFITKNAGAIRTAGIAMTAAGGAMVGSLIAAATKASEFGSTLVDMSSRTGVSVESLSKLGYAAQQTGASIGSVETGLKYISRSAVDALNGTGPAAEAFAKLGISATDASGKMKSSEQLFMEAGNALRKVEDSATRTDLAVQLFGRSGTQLIPMFTDASKSLSDFTAEAENLGLVVGTETANKMDDFGDKLDQLKAQSGKMWAELGAAAIPVLMDFLETVQPIITHVTKWIEKNPTLTQGIITGALALGTFLSIAGPFLIMLPSLASGLSIVAGWFGTAGVAGAVGTSTAAVTGLGTSMTALAAAGGPIALVAIALGALVYEVYKLKQAYDEAAKAGQQMMDNISQEKNLEREYAYSIGMGAEYEAREREIKKARPTLGERAAGWFTGGGVTGQSLAQERVRAGQAPLRRRAAGGPVYAGMPYLVGEEGEEIFVPDQSGKIIPNDVLQKKQFAAHYAMQMADLLGSMFPKGQSGGNVNVMASGLANLIAGAGQSLSIGGEAIPATGNSSSTIIQHFHFNGPIYGDDGIREIAQEEIGKAARAGAYEGRAISYA